MKLRPPVTKRRRGQISPTGPDLAFGHGLSCSGGQPVQRAARSRHDSYPVRILSYPIAVSHRRQAVSHLYPVRILLKRSPGGGAAAGNGQPGAGYGTIQRSLAIMGDLRSTNDASWLPGKHRSAWSRPQAVQPFATECKPLRRRSSEMQAICARAAASSIAVGGQSEQ
jgi:hypothetical protein